MSLEQRVVALEQIVIQSIAGSSRLDRLEQSAIEADKRLTRLENLAERAENRLDNLERLVAENTESIHHLDQKVDKLDQKVDKLDQKVDDGFKKMTNHISSLGSRWGVYNESIWRQTIATVLEQSYGVSVERVELGSEEFDLVISNGNHILIEITARFRSTDVNKAIRKRDLYSEKVQAPTRFIIAAASIHSNLVKQLNELGFEVIEPEADL